MAGLGMGETSELSKGAAFVIDRGHSLIRSDCRLRAQSCHRILVAGSWLFDIEEYFVLLVNVINRLGGAVNFILPLGCMPSLMLYISANFPLAISHDL